MTTGLQRLRMVFLVGLMGACSVVWADKGGNGHGRDRGDDDWERSGHKQKRDNDRGDDRRGSSGYYGEVRPEGPSVSVQMQLAPGVGVYFSNQRQQVAREYYRPEFERGHCPPGLAKKNNGCLPPGQAKQWQRGSRLPSGVVTYPVPAELRVRLGVPPAGHDFVRVAGDILLIAVGTGMVIDAIEDISR